MRLAVLSNGHGEDAVAAGILRHLLRLRPDVQATALPLVGRGSSLEGLAQLTGPREDLPAGGLTLHSPVLFLKDLRAGLPRVLMSQFRTARQLEADAVLVVGDAWAQTVARFTRVPPARHFIVQPLVSVHHSSGLKGPAALLRERFFAPEVLLMQQAGMVWTRDPATAEHLRERGLSRVSGPGNLYLEEAVPPAGGPSRTVLLLPGSRHYSRESAGVMLRYAAGRPDLEFILVWAHDTPPDIEGFTVQADRLVQGEAAIRWQARDLEPLLPDAAAAIATTGTASEQAAAAGVPVISFAVPPAFGQSFLDGQRRLLGRALTVTTRIAADLDDALAEAMRVDRIQLFSEMQERLGASGGSRRIAEELAVLL